MSTINSEYTTDGIALSNSSLGILNTCARKFELRKVYGHARNEREDTVATGSGHALHAGIQNYWTTRDREAATAAFLLRYPAHLQQSHNSDRSLQACYSTLLEMMEHPFDARYKLACIEHNDETRAAVEVPFRIQFPGVSAFPDRYVPFFYDGYIDAILLDTLMQEYVVCDVKTTRKWRQDYSTMFQRDPQCLPYAYVLQKALNQPTDSLRVLYMVAYIDAMAPRVFSYEFPKTAEDIQQWAFTTAFDISMTRQYASLGFFPRRGSQCDTYGICEYNDVCDYTDPAAIRQWLSLAYPTNKGAIDPEFDPWFTINLTIEGLT